MRFPEFLSCSFSILSPSWRSSFAPSFPPLSVCAFATYIWDNEFLRILMNSWTPLLKSTRRIKEEPWRYVLNFKRQIIPMRPFFLLVPFSSKALRNNNRNPLCWQRWRRRADPSGCSRRWSGTRTWKIRLILLYFGPYVLPPLALLIYSPPLPHPAVLPPLPARVAKCSVQ